MNTLLYPLVPTSPDQCSIVNEWGALPENIIALVNFTRVQLGNIICTSSSVFGRKICQYSLHFLIPKWRPYHTLRSMITGMKRYRFNLHYSPHALIIICYLQCTYTHCESFWTIKISFYVRFNSKSLNKHYSNIKKQKQKGHRKWRTEMIWMLLYKILVLYSIL